MEILTTGTAVSSQALSTNTRLTLDYIELSRKEWKPIVICVVFSLIASLFFIYILGKIWKLKKCYSIALFLFIFFLILLIIGDKFIKNLAIFVLSTSALVMVLTIFAFIAADLANCRSES